MLCSLLRRLSLMLALLLLLSSCRPPTPVVLYILLDVSASYHDQHATALAQIQDLTRRLNPGRDLLYIFTMSAQGVFLVKEGRPDVLGLEDVLKAYSQVVDAKYTGTPYREGFERILSIASQHALPSAILCFGDLADEFAGDPARNLSAEFMQKFTQKLPPTLQAIGFLGIDPRFEQKLDPLRAALPERLIVSNGQQEGRSGLGTRQILELIQR